MKDSLGIEVPDVMGKVYPNGEFVVWKPRCAQESPLRDMPKIPGVIDYIGCLVDMEFPEGEFHSEGLRPMGLSIDPILTRSADGISTARGIKGLNGITSHGRRMLRNGCYMLESGRPKEMLTFATLTLPSLSMEEGRIVQENWSGVMQQFKNSFAKLCTKKGLPLEYVYCVEIQEKRSHREGWPVLHVHMVFIGKRTRRGQWRISTAEFDLLWKKALEKYLRSSLDVKASCNMQGIEKSAEAYLSKYLSKGAKSLETWKDEGLMDFFPSHWWGMSNVLRAKVRANIYYGSRVGVDLEKNILIEGRTLFMRDIIVRVGDREIQVGRYGRLSPHVLKSLVEGWQEEEYLPV